MKLTRRHVGLLIGAAGLALFSGLLLPSYTSRPRVRVNRGSCLVACSTAIELVRAYALTNKALPYDPLDGTNALADLGLHSQLVALVHYINDKSLTIESHPRTIVLKCVNSVPLSATEQGRYVAMLSGQLLIVPEKYATLGQVCPHNVGWPVP